MKMKKVSLPELPKRIKVKINRSAKGVFLAELSEYDVFTEADNPLQFFLNVNDLIYAFFDVPKRFQGKIFYAPQPKTIIKRKGSSSASLYPYLMYKTSSKRAFVDCISWL